MVGRFGPSTYYDARNRGPNRRQARDDELVARMAEIRRQKPFTRGFGARKMWLHLRSRHGIDVARCTIERLYRRQGWTGALRRKRVRTTIADQTADRASDRVDRQFWAPRPNQLWCADLTYIQTQSGTVYTAFVLDVFSRRILGWKTDTTMTTSLVLDTLEMALDTRKNEGKTDFTGLIHHNDAGSQYTSMVFTDRLLEAGIDASVGSVADAYDNALAESTIGLYKTELIDTDGPWHGRNDVELATMDWVHFFNHDRPHEALDDLTPTHAEEVYYHRHNKPHAEAA